MSERENIPARREGESEREFAARVYRLGWDQGYSTANREWRAAGDGYGYEDRDDAEELTK
jgi:hypothetical protein